MNISKCRSCDAPIVWLKTKNGKNIPVNANTVEEGDKIFEIKRHKSHFNTCPQATAWRKAPPPAAGAQ